MFKKISYRIALQFTAFVFLFLLVNGAIFLAVDLTNARRQMRFRLERMAEGIAFRFEPGVSSLIPLLPPGMRDRVRILDAEGNTLFAGTFFEDVPVQQSRVMMEITVDDQQYVVFTDPFLRGGRRAGFVQIADVERLPRGDLPFRASLYLLVSAAISILTFIVGLFFARRSLRPAEETMLRLEQFTQDASHELRTPLAALRSSLDLALKTKKYREGIASAKEDVKGVTALVERLLELARLDKFALERRTVDLSALAEATMEKIRPLAQERQLTLESRIESGVHVQGDALLLRQAIGNLLSNAIKFNKKGGRIAVTLAKDALTVADTGTGIPRPALARVFNRFYQADASRANEGFGLGLALVKRIVELHGWTIGVKSKEKEGTAFTIRFHS